MAHNPDWDDTELPLYSNGVSIDQYYKYRDKYFNKANEDTNRISPSLDPMARIKVATMINKNKKTFKTAESLDGEDSSAEVSQFLRASGIHKDNANFRLNAKTTLPNTVFDDDKFLIAGFKGKYLPADHFDMKPIVDTSISSSNSMSSLTDSTSSSQKSSPIKNESNSPTLYNLIENEKESRKFVKPVELYRKQKLQQN